MTENTEKHAFRAEVSSLLNLVTNSLYTHNEIFLRELISNASDALDKARFQNIVDSELRDREAALGITVTADKQRGVLVIEDTGIGMTSEECVENLGTIAHSGTLKFLKELKATGKPADVSLIGQFGVGFYSSFMVATEVTVESLSGKPGSEPVRWVSDGQGEYTLTPGTRTTRGTRIELLLKEESKEFLDRWRIEHLIQRYSNYVIHPIHLRQIDDKGEVTPKEGEDTKQINAGSPIWARSAKEVSSEEYDEFYKHVMGGFVLPGDEALAKLHLNMDAPIQFHALLFVPGRAPADLFMEDRKSLSLYARRVMVDENCDKLLPQYLRFMRGVVDSEDLALNVSRETLQDNSKLASIRKQLTRKSLRLLQDVASEDQERYGKIWREFGAVLKEGLHLDTGNKDELSGLLRYHTIGKGDELISLEQYVEAMPEGQEVIYYIAGEGEQSLRNSPHVEAIRSKGYDVLLMTDAVDEWVLQNLSEYKDKKFHSVTQGDLDEKDEAPEPTGDLKTLVDRAKEILGDRVANVRISKRLTQTAACLVDEQGGLSRNMQRILRAVKRSDDSYAMPATKRILEINPEHAIVKQASAAAASAPNGDALSTWVEILHDLAGLAEGHVADPTGAVKRLQLLLSNVPASPAS